MFNDLRGYIEKVQEMGEYKLIEGANWEEEIGLLNASVSEMPNPPMLLFDSVKGYPKGHRVVCNPFVTSKRQSIALGGPEVGSQREITQHFREKLAQPYKPIPAKEVKTGPVMENVHTGNDVDLSEFPVPKWHNLDGGRYIGTGCCVIMKDPEEGWVNMSTYRVQIHDKAVASIMFATPGRHGNLISEKYWAKGQGCPVVVTCGQEPVLYYAAGGKPWGQSELDWAGWFKGKPIEVIKGEFTGLPIPATAEIALEGELTVPGVEMVKEGPFGEFTGYYAGGVTERPAFRIKAILHRNNPIIQGNAPVAPCNYHLGTGTARLWNRLEQMVPGIVAVGSVPETRGQTVISIKQLYHGHAKQVLLAALTIRGFMCRWLTVVDEDIDPFNVNEVAWALGTRVDPMEQIDFIREGVGSSLDPRVSPQKRAANDFTFSVALINACRPYHWKDEFPTAISLTPEQKEKAKALQAKFLK